MSYNFSTFTLVVKVPGDARTLIQAKKDIEAILEEVRKIKGVEVRRNQDSMIICTNPAGEV